MAGREGFSTGACAAAAAKAAAMAGLGLAPGPQVEIPLPGGGRAILPVAWSRATPWGGAAAVIKDAGDDPDITQGAEVRVQLRWTLDAGVRFEAGRGVGTVTLPGLQIPVGEPAINPGPRGMMAAALGEVTGRGAVLRVAIPGGLELAARTFNPRLGVRGGLSILGSTGRVRPFSLQAVRDTIVCALDVARAAGWADVALAPGHIGERAARSRFPLGPTQVVEVANEWGPALDGAAARNFHSLLLVGHPGKLAKLALGHWDTHSARSPSPVPGVAELVRAVTGQAPEPATTVEGLLLALAPGVRTAVGARLGRAIRVAAQARSGRPCAVALCGMDGLVWAVDGEGTPWA